MNFQNVFGFSMAFQWLSVPYVHTKENVIGFLLLPLSRYRSGGGYWAMRYKVYVSVAGKI